MDLNKQQPKLQNNQVFRKKKNSVVKFLLTIGTQKLFGIYT